MLSIELRGGLGRSCPPAARRSREGTGGEGGGGVGGGGRARRRRARRRSLAQGRQGASVADSRYDLGFLYSMYRSPTRDERRWSRTGGSDVIAARSTLTPHPCRAPRRAPATHPTPPVHLCRAPTSGRRRRRPPVPPDRSAKTRGWYGIWMGQLCDRTYVRTNSTDCSVQLYIRHARQSLAPRSDQGSPVRVTSLPRAATHDSEVVVAYGLQPSGGQDETAALIHQSVPRSSVPCQ